MKIDQKNKLIISVILSFNEVTVSDEKTPCMKVVKLL